jgi:hypothetical protein
MLKITRRPYTACAYRWALSTSGISVGEGDCSDEQCEELNGDFELDFSACASKAGKLVWAGDCEGDSDLAGDCGGRYRLDVSGVSGFDCAATYNGSFTMQAVSPKVACTHCLYATKRRSSGEDLLLFGCDCEALGNEPLIEYGFVGGGYTLPGALFWFFADDAESCINFFGNHSGTIYANATGFPIYNKTSGIVPSAAIGDTVVFTRGTDSACGHTWPDTITATCLATGVVPSDTGPDKNDRIRSKWHLSYDIEAQLWTLRSFNRIDYPIYTLSDSDPCTGDTKTLLLADKGDAADGCGVAPSEVTITRVCPPDRVGKSALLEDRKPNGATGKTKRQCGCDCQDEVDDRRSCATKCTSTEDEGCGNIDPAPDDITCRYPEAINCCDNTAGKDVPCAYTAEFECDIFFDIESVRHKIAAKQVVMRRKCYFEDGCEFVAAGPESSTGGSPVMDVDGYPGAQPVCASCEDLCLTGCTWDAWTVADCPVVVSCGLTYCGPLDEFTIEIPSHTGNPCDGGGTSVPAITITLTYDSTSLGGALFRGTGTLATGAGDIEARVLMYLSANCTDLSVYIGGAFPCDPVAGTGWDYYDKTPSILSECPTTIVFRYTSALYGSSPPTELQTLTVTRV